MKESVRLRFAPSPTGHLHIGNARTAILNWIYARQSGGKFILRIEDTDVERSTRESERTILVDLRWLGLDWDEGPDVGGQYGPYRQSDRLKVYQEQLALLRESGRAYPCFCTEDEIEKKRTAAIERGDNPHYDRKCLHLSQQERDKLIWSGRKPVWRFHVQAGEIAWNDLVKERLAFDNENFGDFVIMRSDGRPTYNFAAAVDDALMGITHVIRGDDHVSNTPKQILIYEAMGWSPPEFCHIPMILGADRSRLSKRHGATSVYDLRTRGYLAEALINFLSLLSWSSKSGDEILSVERLVEEFDFGRMNKSAAIFDTTKFNWMNAHYIRSMAVERLVEMAVPYFDKEGIDVSDRNKLRKVLLLIRDSVETLSQIPALAVPFYQEMVHPTDAEAIALSSKDSSQKVYWAFSRYLQNYDAIDSQTFRSIMKQVQNETGIMGKDLWMPVRIALTGKIHGPDLPLVAEILGKEKCEKFVKNLID